MAKVTGPADPVGEHLASIRRYGRLSAVATAVSAIYVASPEGDTGKSTIALGMLQMLSATAPRSGCSGRSPGSIEDRDYILELLLEHTTADLPYEQSVGVTYEQVHADPDAAISDIVDRFHDVAEQCDAVVIVGSDYTDVASPSELSVNARIAVNLGAPVLLAVRARAAPPTRSPRSPSCARPSSAQHAHTAAIIANRCDPDELDEVAEALSAVRAAQSYVLPEVPLLVAPPVAELQRCHRRHADQR